MTEKAKVEIADLRDEIQRITRLAENHESIAAGHRREIAAIQAEIARRELDAYWEAHPQLTRVAVGDKVVVTAEIVDKYGGGNEAVGKVITVRSINLEYADTTAVSFGVKSDVSIAEASGMRSAYLAAHPENEVSDDDVS